MDQGRGKPQVVKEAPKKEDPKDKDGQSTKGDKGKKDEKENTQKSKKRTTKVISEVDLDFEPNSERLYKITLDVFNPSKNKELHSQLYKD